MPRVSVLVAARDAAATLPRTLGSVAAQTFTDWEVVLTDDGSSDATAATARDTLGARVTVLRHEAALGPAAARNTAASTASGDLLAILDADDRWLPEYLAEQVATYDRAPEGVGIVACDALLEDDQGTARGRWGDLVGSWDGVTLRALLHENTIFTSVVCPAHVFASVGGYEPTLRRGEDYDLWLRILEAGWTVAGTRRPLAVYRLSAGALTADTAQLAADTRRVLERALARGQLERGQRRVARRQIRLQRLIEERALIAATGGAQIGRRIRLLPGLARVAAEHPERWTTWMRARGARTAGPDRHA